MGQKKKRNSVKYRLSCLAPGELTEYNKKYNAEIKATCTRKVLFEPSLQCVGCIYFNAKRYT